MCRLHMTRASQACAVLLVVGPSRLVEGGACEATRTRDAPEEEEGLDR